MSKLRSHPLLRFQGEATLFLMPSEMEYISMLQEVGASLEKADMLQLLNRLPRHPEMPPVNKRAGQSLENHPLAWDLQQRLVVRCSPAGAGTACILFYATLCKLYLCAKIAFGKERSLRPVSKQDFAPFVPGMMLRYCGRMRVEICELRSNIKGDGAVCLQNLCTGVQHTPKRSQVRRPCRFLCLISCSKRLKLYTIL